MEQRVTFAGGRLPAWEAVAGLLAERGYPVQVRMIDGELSFPDEVPPAAWRELRVGTAGGMIALRREGDAVAVVTWGNADAGMRQAWNALAWAWAAAGGGQVEGAAADDFHKGTELPPALTS
jgi:hypothetical protein